MKIPKYQWENSIEEWGSQWKDRLQPSARSRVLQKWNASGKRPKPESSNEYTKRRIKEETKRTWRKGASMFTVWEVPIIIGGYTYANIK